MEFSEARSKLEKVANGKYYGLDYVLNIHPKSDFMETKCSLYIDGYGYSSGPTWKDAFRKLDRRLNGEPLEQMPDGAPQKEATDANL